MINVNRMRFLIDKLDRVRALHSDTHSSVYLDRDKDNINETIETLIHEVIVLINKKED